MNFYLIVLMLIAGYPCDKDKEVCYADATLAEDNEVLQASPLDGERDDDKIVLVHGVPDLKKLEKRRHVETESEKKQQSYGEYQRRESKTPINSGIGAGGIKRDRNNKERKYRDGHERARFVTNNEKRYWDKGIVPYLIHSDVRPVLRKHITLTVMPWYEQYSCIRFVEWNSTTQTDYGLNHNANLLFKESSGCSSSVGRVKTKGNQTISCCLGSTCYHELGHALGFYHEHNAPDRDDYVSVHKDNAKKNQFAFSKESATVSRMFGYYDYSSPMHYGLRAFAKADDETISVHDPDLRYLVNFDEQAFYMFSEIATIYKCNAKCPNFPFQCKNDGYLTLIDGVCECRCPDYLDKTTGCATSIYNGIAGCGDVLNLDDVTTSHVITAPTALSSVGTETSCLWLIKAPDDAQVVLNFEEFSVDCRDTLAINHYKIGFRGRKYCGEGFSKSVISIFNTLSLVFTSSGKKTGSSFQATVTILKKDELCYLKSDAGFTYAGSVDHTTYFEPCIFWDRVPKCPYYQRDIRNKDLPLESNFCRNPGHGTRPWCYTNADNCKRAYCDACNIGNCYDVFSDCDELLTENSNYCTEDAEASRGCRKTCGFCVNQKQLESVQTVSCGEPKIPEDGYAMNTHKGAYSVGETVTVVCKYHEFSRRIITCNTVGSWTTLNYVCGTCQEGWNMFKGHCYKLFDRMNKNSAEAMCTETAPGGHLSAVDDTDHSNFLQAFTQGVKIWLGIKFASGGWIRDDGGQVTWVKWATEFPRNEAKRKCAVLKDGLMENDKCGESFKFACKYEASERKLCVDQKEDCTMILLRNPQFCQLHKYDLALEWCPYSCGSCGESSSCESDGIKIKVGEYVSDACKDGYVAVSGNAYRLCFPGGKLSGSPLECKLESEAVTRVNDIDIRTRRYVGNSLRVYTATNPMMTIQRSGEIVSWYFYSKYDGEVALQVWRPHDRENNQYELVGQNVVRNTQEDRKRKIEIQKEDRIPVKADDILGVYYLSNRGGLPYDRCYKPDTPEGTQQLVSSEKLNFVDITVGQIYQFSSKSDCRVYSLTADIGPKS